jgi:glycosyltransferase involved in cell wall biosynthesis
MRNLSVRFFGPLNNYSGYGYAVKNMALAFSDSKCNTQFAFSDKIKQDYSSVYSRLNNYQDKCDIDFYLHGPPWNRHQSNAKYKIGYFYWEADKLPPVWARGLNYVNEIWAPCKLVEVACRQAGFRGNIKIVPTPAEEWQSDKKVIIPSSISDSYMISDDIFKFYSIFQWNERKGYRELLVSYYRTFTKSDKVMLIIKTNPLNINGNTKEKIKHDILDIKRRLNQPYYPPVYLITDIIPEQDVRALHMTADCYVSPHHGEGWGMPIHDAMLAGKQIITTRFGGVTEFLDENSAHIINHSIGPVKNMSWSSLYTANQNWAYPKVSHLKSLLRDVYENHNSYNDKAICAKKIAESMTISSISEFISNELTTGKIKI